MKKITLLFALVLPVLLTAAAAAMTADELIAKGIEAQGGLENIKAIQTIKATGRALVQGMELPFTMAQKRPGMMRIDVDINGMNMVQAFDGESAWTINPMMGSMEPQDMNPFEAKGFELQADMDGPLVGWQDKGYTVEYIGEADVEGTATHQLRVDTHDGIVMDMFYDAEYFLVIKITSKMTIDETTVESDTYMSDFKESGKLLVPFSIENRMGGQTASTIVIDTIEYDAEVDDASFVRPASK